MVARSGLRWRFTLASMALVSGISALSAIAVWMGQEYVEDSLLEQLMQREVEEYAYQYRKDSSEMPPRSMVLIGFIVPRTTTGCPLLIPPSVPPALFESRTNPSVCSSRFDPSNRIGSCTWLPGLRAHSLPSPISTALNA